MSSLVSDPSRTSAPLIEPLRMSWPVRDSFLTLCPVMRAAAPAVVDVATMRPAAASRTILVRELIGVMFMIWFLCLFFVVGVVRVSAWWR